LKFKYLQNVLNPEKGNYSGHQSPMEAQKQTREKPFFFSDGAVHCSNTVRKDIGLHYR